MFLSIMGGPASGKSYLLAAMTWRLRNVLPKNFHLAFGDADPASNLRLHEYESLQFFNPDQDSLVAIEKTETHGDLYDSVLFGDQTVSFPRPFLFSLSPLESHPNFSAARRVSRVLCLYDNAGESFLPGQDTATMPVTRHLSQSQVLLFLFDPTQDLRFRQACQGKTSDPQMRQRSARLDRERPVRQEIILLEAAQRIRRYSGLAQHAKHPRPLVIVVTKYDCWSSLLHNKQLDDPWKTSSRTTMCAMNLQEVETTSQRVRALLWQLTPELVSAAEQFAERVVYIPVSATGRGPEVDPTTGAFGFRPRDMSPMWAEVPLLYALSRWMDNVVPYYRPKTRPAADANGGVPARVGINDSRPAEENYHALPDADDDDHGFGGENQPPAHADGRLLSTTASDLEYEADVPIAPPTAGQGNPAHPRTFLCHAIALRSGRRSGRRGAAGHEPGITLHLRSARTEARQPRLLYGRLHARHAGESGGAFGISERVPAHLRTARSTSGKQPSGLVAFATAGWRTNLPCVIARGGRRTRLHPAL